MRPSGLVAALAGAVIMLGLWLSGLALGQTQTEDKGTGAPAAAPAAPSSPSPAGSPPAAAAPTAPTAPAAPSQAQAQSDEIVGQEVTMVEQPIVYLSGTAKWDSAFETIVDSLKKVYAFLEKEKIAPTGPPMTIYTSTDEKGFDFRTAVPVAAPPANLPEGFAAAKSPSGKAMKYVHRGTYDTLDDTYERITNQLDDKGLEAQDVFVETYLTDPRTTPDDKLVIEVYVPIK
jgi:effector-binding domain-containing protein